MRRTATFPLLLLPALLWAQTPADLPRALVFTHVTVIDATGDAARPDMTMVITGDRITALGRAGQVTTPKDAQVVDAAGKFLIPGLWDMHVHIGVTGVKYDSFFPLFVANGVTGVRDMGGVLHQVQFDVWRQEIDQGRLLGPRLVAAGTIVDGSRPVRPSISVAAADGASGRLAVQSLARSGADFVKIYSLLGRDAYFAIADEAQKRKIPFAGHVPDSVTATEASDAGQKSIEHLLGVALSCSTNEAGLRKHLTETSLEPDVAWLASLRIEAESLNSYSPEKAARLFARFAKNDTWQCPTLTALRALASADGNSLTHDARFKYLPLSLQRMWSPAGVPLWKDQTAESIKNQRRSFLSKLDLVKTMHRAGVGLLAGTDAPSLHCYPGFGLHDELELMVEAGLTPMQALQTATLNPARYLGKEQDLGTVGVGKLADLVLLDANPLVDIRNTRQINAVVINGRLLDRAKLDHMLADVEAANRKP